MAEKLKGLSEFIESLERLDQRLFILLNQTHDPVFDFIMFWASDKFIWIPFYALMIYIVARKLKWDAILFVLAAVILLVMTDQITSAFMKPFFERLRPCHHPVLSQHVHLVAGCGGKYGFASSHAANVFGFAALFWAILRPFYKFAWLLFVWAALVSYSRVYLGVHYPGDITIGAIIGILLGWLVYYLTLKALPAYRKLRRSIN